MRYFPIFTHIEDKSVLVVGGGEDAARKVRLLAKTSANIRIVAQTLTAELDGLVSHGAIEWCGHTYTPALLDDAALVYVAQDDLARQVSADAQARNVPVNVVDKPDLSTFITPALIDRDPVVVAIGTEGSGPVLAQLIKAHVEALLPTSLGALASYAQSLRGRVETVLPAGRARRDFWRTFFTGKSRDAFLRRDEKGFQSALEDALATPKIKKAGRVDFIGWSSGAADLLTIKAHRKLIEADILIYEAGTSPEILEFARRDAERLIIPSGAASAELVELASSGKSIVRLIPGAFSRQSTEVAALQRGGIAFDVVPGVDLATVLSFPDTHQRQSEGVAL
ncbi:MAG: NAD(P)-dependent oxidoreductase [Hyphomicrobiales bacterium]